MSEIEENKASENNGNKVKKSGSKGIAWLSVLSGIQFILIIILFAQMDEHNHWDYARESHSHSSSDVAYHDHDYADSYHTHYESHEHSAKDIAYKSFEYGGYGTLQSKLSEIDDKAKKYHTHSSSSHTHSSYELPSHTHDSYEVYGVAKSYHMH